MELYKSRFESFINKEYESKEHYVTYEKSGFGEFITQVLVFVIIFILMGVLINLSGSSLTTGASDSELIPAISSMTKLMVPIMLLIFVAVNMVKGLSLLSGTERDRVERNYLSKKEIAKKYKESGLLNPKVRDYLSITGLTQIDDIWYFQDNDVNNIILNGNLDTQFIELEKLIVKL